MATRYVHAGTATGDGTEASPWTMAQANANVGLGDTLVADAGTYATTFLPAVSPASEAQRITVQPEDGVIATFRTADLRGKKYVTLSGLSWMSIGSTMILMSSGSFGNIIEYCTFDSDADYVADMAYQGLQLSGGWSVFRFNTLLTWYGGDYVRVTGHHHYLHDNDCRWADAGHHIFSIGGSHCVDENNKMRNQWARPHSFVTYDGLEQGWNLTQKNMYLHVNWDDVHPYTNKNHDGDGAGDENMMKMCNTNLINRNNAWIDVQAYSIGLPDATSYRCIWQIGNYNSDNAWGQRQHVYHNTVYDNEIHAIAATSSSNNTPIFYAGKNRFFNNVLHNKVMNVRQGLSTAPPLHTPNVALYARATNYISPSGSRQWMADWDLRANLINAPIKHGSGYDGSIFDPANPGDMDAFDTYHRKGMYTVPEFASAFPARVVGNIVGSPTLVNDNYATYVTNRGTWPDWDNFTLESGLGKNDAEAIATVTSGSSGTTINCDRAEAFWPNVRNIGGVDTPSVIPGDDIIITGALGQRTTTVDRVNTETQLRVTSSVTVQAGDKIWLAAYGVNPDIGIASTSTPTDPPPDSATEISAPVLLHAAVIATADGNTIAPATFTVPANALLIVPASANGTGAGVSTLPVTISDNFSGGSLSWTQYTVERGTTGSRVAEVVFVARSGPNPGSGYPTVTWSNTPGNKTLSTISVATGVATPPVTQSVTADIGWAETFTATLSTAPAATSLVMGFLASRGPSPAITHDPDAVELAETLAGTNHSQQIQYILGGSAADMTWSGTLGASGNAALILEIAEGEAVPYYVGVGAVTLPMLTAIGTGVYASPAYVGSGTATLPALVANGTGAFDLVAYMGAGAAILPALTASGTGTHTSPNFTGAGDATLPALSASGTGAYEPPLYVGSGAVTLPALTAQGVGIISLLLYVGRGQGTLPTLSASGTGAYTMPAYVGHGEAVLPPVLAQGAGDFHAAPVAEPGITYFIATAHVEI